MLVDMPRHTRTVNILASLLNEIPFRFLLSNQQSATGASGIVKWAMSAESGARGGGPALGAGEGRKLETPTWVDRLLPKPRPHSLFHHRDLVANVLRISGSV